MHSDSYCSVSNVALALTGNDTNTIGYITGTTSTNVKDDPNGYDEFVNNTVKNCTITIKQDGDTIIAITK